MLTLVWEVSVSQIFASCPLWVFREPVGCAENEGPFLWVRAGSSEAVIIMPASVFVLNPYNSRRGGILLCLLFWPTLKVDHPYLEQISQLTAITGCVLFVCCLPELDQEYWEQDRELFHFICITSAHNPVKRRKKRRPGNAEEIKKCLEITDDSPGGFCL